MRDVRGVNNPSLLHEEPGLIAMLVRPTGLTGGFMCLVALDRPPKTGVMIIQGTNIPQQRNEAVKAMLSVPQYKWLLFVDDDQTYPPDALMRLLAARTPVVGAVMTGKFPAGQEYEPWVFTVEKEGEVGRLRRMRGPELAGTGLLQVGATGTGFLLIRRKVFEGLEPPWFEFGKTGDTAATGEDVNFCVRANNAGFGVFVDRGLKIGHLTVVSARLNDDGTSGLTHDRFLRREYVK